MLTGLDMEQQAQLRELLAGCITALAPRAE